MGIITGVYIYLIILTALCAVCPAIFILRHSVSGGNKKAYKRIRLVKKRGIPRVPTDRCANLIPIIEKIESNEPFSAIIRSIYDSFAPYIPYSYIGVALIDETGRNIRAAYGISGDANLKLAGKLVGYRTDIAQTSLNDIIISGKPRVINDLAGYLNGKPMKYYNRILLDEGIRSSITFPLIKNNIPIGIIFFSSRRKNVYKKEHVEFLKPLVNSIMLSLERDLLLDEMVVGSTLALATLAEERDNETGEHLERMKSYSMLMTELLMKNGYFTDVIDSQYINSIYMFSPLHDIGKVAVSDLILLKPGKLTPQEFQIMKSHTTYGGKVLRLADENVKKRGRSIFKMGIEITEGHHEWWDGSGYPYHRAGERIPLSARIVAVADVLDALTSKRPYKAPISFEKSADMIIEKSGTHFDPRIINVFKNNLDDFKKLYDDFSSDN